MNISYGMSFSISNIIIEYIGFGLGMGVVFHFFFSSVATLPLERMGSFPVSRTVTVCFATSFIVLRTWSILLNLMDFWRKLVEIYFISGSVEETRSLGRTFE